MEFISISSTSSISSHVVVSHLPAIRNALSIGRDGAALVAASVAAQQSIATLRGGAAATSEAKAAAASPQENEASKGTLGVQERLQQQQPERLLGIPVSPEKKSIVYISIAMACHYLGYSLARPVTVALFTSESTGYAGTSSAFPLAMAFVSPFSFLLLLGYTTILAAHGPAGALTRTTCGCAFVVSLAAVAIAVSEKMSLMVGSVPVVKLITGPLFVFRESYVQLLTSQYWSFASSVATPAQSAVWFGPMTSLTSITSALAGLLVQPLVGRIGLSGALLGTGLTLLLSLFGSWAAYDLADKYGFAPTDNRGGVVKKHNPSLKETKPKTWSIKRNKDSSEQQRQDNMFRKAVTLFQRVPVLGALFVEILASQGLATVLNVCFVACLGKAIPNDADRAGWVGMFFSIINVITMVLQFAVLPVLINVIEPRFLWRALPVISLCFAIFQATQKDPSLWQVASSLLVMKVSEYSARRMLDEMVFVPLDYESRFVGKEVIGVFGYRFGKSLMSLGLSALSSVQGLQGLQPLSVLSSAVALWWLRAAWRLSCLVPTRQQAEEAYQQQRTSIMSKSKNGRSRFFFMKRKRRGRGKLG